MKLFIVTIIIATGGLGALLSPFLLFRFRWNKGGPILWIIKSYISAFSFYLGIAGFVCGVIGILTHSFIAELLGVYCFLVYFGYLGRIALINIAGLFKNVFGSDWESHISIIRRKQFLENPLQTRLPESSNFLLKQNVAFAIMSENGRELLCDLWLPSENVKRSGLAFIYLHGGAWYYLDKGFYTHSFFKHLASQGHVVMDIAYRLCPETDMIGMIQDAKRAIGWMKTNASLYKIDPDRLIIGGGSAGGHIALMAAYLPNEERLSPPELADQDLSVKGVISLYGPPDLKALYYYTGQHFTTKQKSKKTDGAWSGLPYWVRKMMGNDYWRLGFDKLPANAGALCVILGCNPGDCPHRYSYFSPISHVHKNCPPTLLLQGDHDMFTPIASTRYLSEKLTKVGVPVITHILPCTDHGFDLFSPKHSPIAHVAFYDVERFLAVMAEG